MALDTELEIREVGCLSTQHCIDLFLEPINDSVGKDCAKHPLHKTETTVRETPDFFPAA